MADFIDSAQAWVASWTRKCFGPPDKSVRALRLVEEALEFAQAVGVPESKCTELVGHVYSRPVGDASQELGGIGLTWLAAADAVGIRAGSAMVIEINRVSLKTVEHFAERDQEKRNAGFGPCGPEAI